jgi:DNA-binding Xre family transcriptional regulator
MGIPTRRITEQEASAIIRKALKKVMKKHNISPEEFDRRLKESQLPFNPMRPFGPAVQELRKAQGMTRRDLAARTGVSLTMVTRLERGFLRDISLTVLMNLCYALSISAEDLLKKAGWPDTVENPQE